METVSFFETSANQSTTTRCQHSTLEKNMLQTAMKDFRILRFLRVTCA